MESTPRILSSPWILGVGLDFTLEIGGKRGYRIAQAREPSDAARLSIATVAWQARGRVRGSLLALFAAKSAAAEDQDARQVAAERPARALELAEQGEPIPSRDVGCLDYEERDGEKGQDPGYDRDEQVPRGDALREQEHGEKRSFGLLPA